jgi:hypothetical protein
MYSQIIYGNRYMFHNKWLESNLSFESTSMIIGWDIPNSLVILRELLYCCLPTSAIMTYLLAGVRPVRGQPAFLKVP